MQEIHTKTRREEHDIEVGQELLLLGIKVAKPGNNIARQAYTNDLENGLEDEKDQVAQGRVGIVRLLKGKERHLVYVLSHAG